jgi:hypothetical protein
LADANEPRDADFEQASSQLNQGLKSCRAVVDNYRAILGGETAANDDDRDAANNDAGWEETA